ncbi:hypothetical protein ACRAWD_24035 [Caulobacter segnis]
MACAARCAHDLAAERPSGVRGRGLWGLEGVGPRTEVFQVIDQESRLAAHCGRFDWDGEIGGKRADAFFGAWRRQGDLDSHFYVNVRGARGAHECDLVPERPRRWTCSAKAALFVTDRFAVVGGATWGQAERDYVSVAVPEREEHVQLRAPRGHL